MSNLTIEGKLVEILALQEGTSTRGAWKKQDFILETLDQYPKKVCISGWNEKADEIMQFKPNEMLSVSINVESREYNSKWYTDVKAWKIDRMGNSAAAPANTNSAPAAADDITGVSFSSDDEGDLPF
jgi:hypothetical protein